MKLAWLVTFLITYQLAAILSAPTIVYADEPSDEPQVTQRTFIAPVADKVRFGSTIASLNKINPSGKALQAVDMPDLGFSLVTGSFTDEEADKLLSEGYQEPDSLEVSLFADGGCEARSRLEPVTGDKLVPPNVCRVVGSPSLVTSGSAVWIIDSGVDEDVVTKGLLNISERIDCMATMATSCDNTVTSLPDHQGHGTMVAGIIGGMRVAGTTSGEYLGIVGVTPGVPLKIVKAFEDNKSKIFGPPLVALRYVRDNASAGEILNISWGAQFMETARKGGQLDLLGKMDKLLFEIANKQVRIVIAAGNAREDDEASWVQSFFPANASEYFSPDPTQGFIQSVSASKSTYVAAGTGTEACSTVSDAWCDELWNGGSFGAAMSEPGVGVQVLWRSTDNHKLRQNICSGTSLAAPVLAGLLARNTSLQEVPVKKGVIPNADPLGFSTAGTPDVTDPDYPKCN
ncbi:S8 family serine peptidase [Mesorhizobium neociceri]|uniref:S8 family serine peptidase n=1 Tax=Mesorhizobium neociceri TaxID=1307853 RepID=A0A838B1Y7_9HYPH|nr:S8 family serine peptidase [Mesorhizobium neociceri]MBA1140103.1 S8 family serine peptidase [Mesorhizobium neociceri]